MTDSSPLSETGSAARIVALESGGDLRRRSEGQAHVALLINGGTAKAVPGTWSATSEYLAERLAARYPEIEFAELRYRLKSWNEFDACREDAEAALAALEDREPRAVILIGFSMGGAVSAAVAADPSVAAVLGLAPWLPDRLPLDRLAGKRFDVIHGGWDRWFPGIPGVSAGSSRAGFDRAQRLGAHGTYTLIARALHGAAVRRPSGKLLPLPRAHRWVDEVGVALERFVAAQSSRSGGSRPKADAGPSEPMSGA